MSERETYTVRAYWDEESRTYHTDGQDFPGLYVEAKTYDELVQLVVDVIPELLAANRARQTEAPASSMKEVTVHVTTERSQVTPVAA